MIEVGDGGGYGEDGYVGEEDDHDDDDGSTWLLARSWTLCV